MRDGQLLVAGGHWGTREGALVCFTELMFDTSITMTTTTVETGHSRLHRIWLGLSTVEQ